MAKPFDPYHSWLGIQPEEQPPNHYRLLGVQAFEDNPDAIENAADQRMAHLRTFQTGRRGELSQNLLNEVSSARLCLLKPEEKVKYDEQLREILDAEAAKSAPEPVKPPPFVPAIDISAPASKPEQKPPANLALIIGSAAAGVLVILGILFWVAVSVSGRGNGQPPEVAEGPQTEVAETPPPTPLQVPSDDKPAGGSNAGMANITEPTGGGGFPEPVTPFYRPPDRDTGPREIPDQPDEPWPSVDDRPPVDRPVDRPRVDSPPVDRSAKRPIPKPDVQEPILTKLDELFSISKVKTPLQKRVLARKLLEVADESRGNPDERFVVLRKAMEMAAAAGDAGMMFDAVDTIAGEYQLDSLTGKANMLSKFADGATDKATIEQLLQASLQVIEQAVAEGRLDVAMKAADLTHQTVSRRPAGKEFRKETFDRREALKEVYDEWRDIQQAQELLAVNPNDAQAHLTLGRWLCFRQGDWNRGLPHLAKANDPELAMAAQKDLTGPKTDPADQLKLADAWWKLAETRKGPEKFAVAGRAAHWYEQARAGLPGGLDKARAEVRLKAIAKLGQPASEGPSAPVAPDRKPDRKPDRRPKRKFFSPQAVATTFGLQRPKWGILGNAIQGHVTDIKKPENNPASKPYRTNSLEFGFKMRAKWFQTIHIFVDDKRYSYVRGAVFGTSIHDGTKDRPRVGEKVIAPDGWSSLAVTLKDDTVSFYYNDVMEWAAKVPEAEGSKHTVVVGFGSNAELKLQKTIIGIKDIYIERE